MSKNVDEHIKRGFLNKMKKLLLGIMVILGLLTGCGSGEDETAAVEEAIEETTVEKVHLTYTVDTGLVVEDDTTIEIPEDVLGEFENQLDRYADEDFQGTGFAIAEFDITGEVGGRLNVRFTPAVSPTLSETNWDNMIKGGHFSIFADGLKDFLEIEGTGLNWSYNSVVEG